MAKNNRCRICTYSEGWQLDGDRSRGFGVDLGGVIGIDAGSQKGSSDGRVKLHGERSGNANANAILVSLVLFCLCRLIGLHRKGW